MTRTVDIAASFVGGLVFGIGLIVSRMFDPSKVKGFLDLAGAWDPSLALVMAGAVAVGIVAFAVAKRRRTTLLGEPLVLPLRPNIDRRLVVGSLLFGIGWGIAGICPGPALVAVGAGHAKALVFTLAMLGGMALFTLLERRRPAAAPALDEGARAP
jgi:uncharacterized membrane protein YedE/YeeE